MKKTLLAAVIAAAALISTSVRAEGPSFDQVTHDNLGVYNPLSGAWITKGNSLGTFDNQYTFHTEQDMNLETNIRSSWGTITNFESSIDGHVLTGNHGILFLSAGDHTYDVRGHSGLYGSGYDADIRVTAVPEPESWALLLAGLGLMGFVARRKQ